MDSTGQTSRLALINTGMQIIECFQEYQVAVCSFISLILKSFILCTQIQAHSQDFFFFLGGGCIPQEPGPNILMFE